LTAYRPDWWDHAACLGMGTELFFDVKRVEEARAVCAGCPAQIPCGAVGKQQNDGMWAGAFKADHWKRRKPGRKPKQREHGTNAGYYQHRRLSEDACPSCLSAHALAQLERKEQAS
jgi:hypothetical protein